MYSFEKNFGDAKGKFTMANLTTIKNIEIPLPSIEEQQTLMTIIENKEQEIEKLKRILTHISYEKEQVIKKYL